ncbi:MAG: ABC transporter substrate-binding protein [Clostridia bacterium]|nr:ABC transporter substrate-binding protein [Clostridia bacterium]
MKKSIRILSLFLALLTAVGLCACGKSTKAKYEIGICQLVEHTAHTEATKGFMDALNKALGEENIHYDVQSAQNDISSCSAIINQFVANDVDLILANATSVLQTAASATSEIPVLGTSVTEYGVALDIENFNGTVGTNVSGTSDLASLEEQAKMIVEWVPDVKSVALLFCSAEANSQYQVDEVEKYLEAKGITATQYPFADSNDLSGICQKAAEENDVIYVPTDNTVASNSGIIDNICRPMKKVVFAGEAGMTCGVASLSVSYYEVGYATGEMAAKILLGEADISKMPIQYADATKRYNKELCDELGLTPPEGYEPIE